MKISRLAPHNLSLPFPTASDLRFNVNRSTLIGALRGIGLVALSLLLM